MEPFQISGKMKWKLKKLQELTCFFLAGGKTQLLGHS